MQKNKKLVREVYVQSQWGSFVWWKCVRSLRKSRKGAK